MKLLRGGPAEHPGHVQTDGGIPVQFHHQFPGALGDVDTLDALAIYELIRPNNVKFVSVMAYRWDGQVRYILKEAKENEAS